LAAERAAQLLAAAHHIAHAARKYSATSTCPRDKAAATAPCGSGQSCSCAYCSTSRCPRLAAPYQVLLSHGQPCSCTYRSILRCPLIAAALLLSHSQPCSCAYRSTSRCPPSAAWAAVQVPHGQPRECSQASAPRCPSRAALEQAYEVSAHAHDAWHCRLSTSFARTSSQPTDAARRNMVGKPKTKPDMRSHTNTASARVRRKALRLFFWAGLEWAWKALHTSRKHGRSASPSSCAMARSGSPVRAWSSGESSSSRPRQLWAARAHSADHAPDQRPRCERVREVRARSVSGIGPAQAPLRYVRGRRGRGAERAGSAAHRLGRRAAARVRRAGPRHRPAAHGRARAAGAAALQVRCPTTPTSSCRRRIRSHADVFVQKTNAKIYQVEAVRYDLANLPDEYG